ncbi:TerD family protein [Nocardia sp. NPDC057227]|uniref:TerD family protein n=1 Tax=Nocardia sp. NPDC057227 TaxID=3346056 RepID=UPI00363E421C
MERSTTPELSRGAHTEVPGSLLAVVISWRSEHAMDAVALLLGADGTVRSDRDLVFFNAPRHLSQAVTLDQQPEPHTARLSVSLPRTEAAVQRIVIGGALDAGTFAEMSGLTLEVLDASGPVTRFAATGAEPVRALLFGEFYRRDGGWRFRAVGQGWASGLAGLVTEFGVAVAESDRRGPELTRPHRALPPPPPPAPERADWHPDPDDRTRLRWWDGSGWTTETAVHVPAGSRRCPRCGAELRRRVLGGLAPCRGCEQRVAEYLAQWQARARRVLAADGLDGTGWDDLLAALRYRRIEEHRGRELLREIGIAHAERLVTFAFADGEVLDDELESFEHAVTELRLGGPLIDDLRRRMQRGHTLSRLRGGQLPLVRAPGLHLDPEEAVHLDSPAVHLRILARGPRRTEGRLIASNKKLRFTGHGIGTELPWARVVSVRVEGGAVVVAATSARGGATFTVADPEYVAAVLEGALRVAKRLVLSPGQRDSRSVPQEVKAAVWQRDGGRCVECGDGHYLEFDHIIPISRGGATSAANLQILCRACNRAKGARI